MEIYERIETLCKEKGTNVTQMCSSVGIPRSSLVYLKQGVRKSISVEAASKIARYFHVTVEYIMYGKENSDGVKIPVYGVIAAGLPILAEQEIIDYEEIPAQMAKSGEYFALQVRGDSMEPRMYSGDVVILRKCEEFESGKVCAVMVNGEEATLKRVLVRPNGITLVALNPKYEPMNFNAKQIEELPVRCMGIAVEIRGKLLF